MSDEKDLKIIEQYRQRLLNDPSFASKAKRNRIIIPFIFITFILLALFTFWPNKKETKLNDTYVLSGHIPSLTDKKTAAFVLGKILITEQLKCPSTAKFPVYNVDYIESQGDSFLVSSYVDAQNSFGAMIRTKWYFGCVFTGGDIENTKNWIVLNCLLDPR